MARMIELFPELQQQELAYIHEITKGMSEEDLKVFANIYRARRRDPQLVLLSALGGLFLLPGLQRFVVNQIGLGLLYLFTIGLCFIGSIVDLINYQNMAFEYNRGVANDVLIAVSNNYGEIKG